jgi:hypothetical protein
MPRPNLLEVSLPRLANGPIPDVSPFFGDEGADHVAELALLIDQAECSRAGVLRDFTPYQDLPQRTRTGMRVSTIRVVQALVLLGWISPDP